MQNAPWKQVKELTSSYVEGLAAQEAISKQSVTGKVAKSAAKSALNRGKAAGANVKRKLHEEPSSSGAESSDSKERCHANGAAVSSLTSQATRFLAGIQNGTCSIYELGGGSERGKEGSPGLAYLMTVWNHNYGRPKPLGRPSKDKALLETVHWDTLGKASCTCDRGRLGPDAPCVHKLALEALGSRQQANHVALQKGRRVIEVPCSRGPERVFGVYWNAASPSPKRTMVHLKNEGVREEWYCEGGKLSGCSTSGDCDHIRAVKDALCPGRSIEILSGCLFSEDQLARARAWLLETDRKEERKGAPESKEGGSAEVSSDMSSVERYLMELCVGQPHDASCKGASCFCKQHQQLFGGVDFERGTCKDGCCKLETNTNEVGGKRGRQESGDRCSGRGPKRSKAFWAAQEEEGGGQLKETGALQAEKEEVVPTHTAPQTLSGGDGRDAMSGVTRVCASCVCPALACPHVAGNPLWAPVLPLDAKSVQLELPKLVRPTDSFEVHDPLVTSLRRPVRVSELVQRDFEELSAVGCLSAPCPKPELAPCGTAWQALLQSACVHSLQWSQEVKVRIYCCRCPVKHTVHFNGEALGLYAWSRAIIVTQESCQLLLRIVQGTGSAFSGLISAQKSVRGRFSPGAAPLLSEESWRKVCLAFFRLCGQSILECCSLCGPHPDVLLCDGIAGLACADGSRSKGGLAGTAASELRPFTAPSRNSSGETVVKHMEAGVNFSATALEGRGLKRRLIHQPELRALLARYSQHHPKDPDLGAQLSEGEFQELLVALDRDDVELVSDFVANPDDADAEPILLHWRRRLLQEQIGQIRSKNRAARLLLEGIRGETPGANNGRVRSPRKWWAEPLYALGSPQTVSDDSNLIQHWRALAVVRAILLGGPVDQGGKAVLAEHAPILRRVLDNYDEVFPAFFFPTLHHLYRLTLFGRGAVGLGVGRAGWALSAIEGLDACVWLLQLRREVPGSWNEEREESYTFWRGRANRLLPGVEALRPPPPLEYALNQAERELLHDRLGLSPDGRLLEALPKDHPYCQEQNALGCYPLPSWEQKRPLPQYKPFENDLGLAVESSEEHRCKSGLTVGEFDAKVAAAKSEKAGKRLQKHTKGGFVFCCSHRVIYGFHAMLRGESPRDPFAVLYTRLQRHNLPSFLFYDNACKLRAFHFQKTGAEAHKCGPQYNPDLYDAVRWVNTSAVESVNSFLIKFKVLAWFSALESFMIILANVVSGRNAELTRVDDQKIRIAARVDQWSPAVRAALLYR
ncbi:hypothetical protein KFL_006880050 [Klebsormidium nitens]|uniref:SWIM-type domain-containing protein n=1 Tax=Klebsormidium nitens TaxID=105231 RepID=A0A1Y1IJC9_KLENI|nr:hypothetical protein KFL_006880050 [Klebsormidium nitens]|eukprot:GAQ90813.1 hypothetical protein KFL_006880050 [Klebsormidium nitens]